MTNFDYLADAPPHFVERLRARRIEPWLRPPLTAIVTAIGIVAGWWLLEHHWLTVARQERATAAARLVQSRLAFAHTKSVRADLDELIRFDGELRRVRVSGAKLASSLAELANRVPRRAWLTALAENGDDVQIEGQADGLDALGDTVSSMMASRTISSPSLVRATRVDKGAGTATVAFALHARGRK